MERQKYNLPPYPEATKGQLRPPGTLPPPPSQKRLFRIRDHEPSALIAMTIGIALLVFIIGFAAFYIVYQRSRQTPNETAAIAIAQKLAEHNASDSYAAMEKNIHKTFKTCSNIPQVSITHYYREAGQPETVAVTIIDFSKGMTNTLDEVMHAADSAVRNELQVACVT